MAQTFTLQTVFKAGGNLINRMRRNGQAVNRFSRTTKTSMAQIKRNSRQAGFTVNALTRRIGALAAAGGGLRAGKFFLSLDQRLVRLGIQSKRTNKEIDALYEKIRETAISPDIRIDSAELLSAVEKIVEKTGDLDFAENSLRTIAQAIQAAGAAGKDIGALVSEFKKMGIEGEKGVRAALDTLITQGKAGAFTLENLASQGERVVSAYAGMGFTGQKAVQELGALLQVSRQGTGSAEQAATAFEALLRSITDKASELNAVDGITIFDPVELAKGNEVFVSISNILDDIFNKTDGKSTSLNKIFGGEAGRAISALKVGFQNDRDLRVLKIFQDIVGDGGNLDRDSTRIATTSSAKLEASKEIIIEGADDTVTPVLNLMSDMANRLLGNANDRADFEINKSPQSNAKSRDDAALNNLPQPTAKLVIELNETANKKLKVKSVRQSGIEIDVTNGPNMVLP